MRTYDRARMHRALDAVLTEQQREARRTDKDRLRAKLQIAWSTAYIIYKADGTGAFNDVLANIEEAMSALNKVPDK